jgi:hypothetical protein
VALEAGGVAGAAELEPVVVVVVGTLLPELPQLDATNATAREAARNRPRPHRIAFERTARS